MPEAICFDLDGTLFDDRQYVRGGLRNAGAVLKAHTGTDLTEALLEAYFKRGVRGSTFDTVLAEHDLPLDLVPTLVEAYHENDAPLTPFADVKPTLSTLKRDYELGIVTGGHNGHEKLLNLGIVDLFDAIVVAPQLGLSKKDPEPFEAVLAALDVSASETVYVGDRPEVDFPQANDLGMVTVRVLRGQYADCDADGDAVPDVTINSLATLPEIVS